MESPFNPKSIYTPDKLSGKNISGRSSLAGYHTMSNWQYGTGLDRHSSFGDPMFHHAADNLHLMPWSPASDAKIALPEIATDYKGISVDNPPNIGACETIK